MYSPKHTHVTIQNSPDNVSFRYIWSIPLNSISKSFPSLSMPFSLTFYQTVLMLDGVSSVLFVKWVCWWLVRVIMIFHFIFPIDIRVDLCHFKPPNVQYVHDPNTVMRTIIWIGRGMLSKRIFPTICSIRFHQFQIRWWWEWQEKASCGIGIILYIIAMNIICAVWLSQDSQDEGSGVVTRCVTLLSFFGQIHS